MVCALILPLHGLELILPLHGLAGSRVGYLAATQTADSDACTAGKGVSASPAAV
jgi:hypothetical protein